MAEDQDTLLLPVVATDEMVAAVKNVVSPYAARKIWNAMVLAYLLRPVDGDSNGN